MTCNFKRKILRPNYHLKNEKNYWSLNWKSFRPADGTGACDQFLHGTDLYHELGADAVAAAAVQNKLSRHFHPTHFCPD